MFVNLGHDPRATFGNNSAAGYYSAAAIQERYERMQAGLLALGTKRWSDGDRKNKLADDERRRRARNLLDQTRTQHFWKTKTASDRKLPNIDRPRDALHQTAFHESGHAVEQGLQGLECGLVSIVPSPTTNGQMFLGFVHGSREQRIRMTMAGPIAAAIWCDSTWEPGSSDRHFGDGTDLEHIELEGCGRNSVEFFSLRREVEESLKANWSLVSVVADLLMEHHTILGSEITALVEAHKCNEAA